MKILFILASLLLLAACASPAPTTALEASRQDAATFFTGTATLASFGTFEMELAPAYTRLAVLRHNAARDLGKGRITVDAARDVQAGADAARARLDKARELDAALAPGRARAALAEALQAIASLEGRRK